MSDPKVENFQPPPPPIFESEKNAPRPTNLRIPAIVLFVVGLVVVIGGIARFIPGGVGTGAAFCFFGIVLFAFSLISLPEPSGDAEQLSLGQRLASIFYEPSRVFRYLRSYPRWLAPFLIVAALTVIYTAAFTQRLTPERIVNHTMDKLAESGIVPAAALEKSRAEQVEAAKNPVQRAGNAVKAFVAIFAISAFVAALYLLGVLVFGGRINYWQALAATFWASLPVTVIQKVVSLIILFIKSPDDIHPILNQETLVQDNLGVLFTPAEHPVLFVAASTIGVLSLYGLWLRAKGLQFAGYKVSSTAAWGSAVLVWVLWVILALVITSLFPSFVS